MTLDALFKRTLSLMGADYDEESDYRPKLVDTLNILLAENFDLNNSLRENAGEEPLAVIPSYTELQLSETLTYDDRITVGMLPYGIAGNLLIADGSNVLGDKRLSKYEYEREHLKPVVFTDVDDIYK